MKSSWWFRFSLLVAITIGSILLVMPTFLHFNPEGKFPVKSKIGLGLDLQGGLYMILGIDFQNVYKDEMISYARKFQYALKDIGIESTLGDLNLSDKGDPQHSIVITDPAKTPKAKERIREYFGEVVRLTAEKNSELSYGLATGLRSRIEEQAVTKSIEVVRNRIDEFGVTEPEITSQGSDRIVIQLPGVRDIERAKELIGKTAKLEFRLVNDDINQITLNGMVAKAEQSGIVYKKGDRFSLFNEKVNEFLKAELPKGYEILFQKKVNRLTNELENKTPYIVEKIASISGDDLEDANVNIDQQKNQPYVSMTLKSEAAKRFEDLTGANKGKRLAVILDGNVYTAPHINDRIGGGRAQITLGQGNFNETLNEAKDIALVLRAGALPVALDFEEQRIVGPSLGQDSIHDAKIAGTIACAAVFGFAVIYYKISGLIAVITLLLNVLFLLAALVCFDATLTLPGIAGIVLTVGMAIDANIIIHERIREELRRGMHAIKAMQAGFEHAFWTIIDANTTTALAGLCLLHFGTGPIRGFALTLLIGIISTVYCSYFVANILFELYAYKVVARGKEFSI
ncbi:MAG: protein translocase subunit SecD [Oligoflexia bacterium]|nr:protein translocase subunit SecD [Oligoflexia bacterium]